jgi:hypothetical protein
LPAGKVAVEHSDVERLILPLIGAVLACFATGCQTTSNIAQHYQGAKYKPLPSASTVQIRKLPVGNAQAHTKSMNKQGYLNIGKAFFTAEMNTLDEIKGFAASIGADVVDGLAVPVGTEQRSYMGVASYTPGRTATTFGAASAYGSGTSAGNIYSPNGNMQYSGQSSGSAYGTSVSSTYIPPSVTYAPQSYEVPIAQQAYVFWLSPSGYLRNWKFIANEANAGNPPEQQISQEEIKRRGAIFAQAWSIPLPSSLRPKEPIPQLPPEVLAKARGFTAEAQNAMRSAN